MQQFYWQNRCCKHSGLRETGAISELTTNLALVTGRLPVSSAACHTHQCSTHHPHPPPSYAPYQVSNSADCAQLHAIVLRGISHSNETRCRHGDACSTSLHSASDFLSLLFFACFVRHHLVTSLPLSLSASPHYAVTSAFSSVK